MIGGSGLLIIVNSFFNGNVDLNHFQLMSVIIFAGALFLLRVKKLNPIYIMFISGIIQVLIYYLFVSLWFFKYNKNQDKIYGW